MSFYWLPLCVGTAIGTGALVGVLPSFESNWEKYEGDFHIDLDGGARSELLYEKACFDQQYMVSFNR